MKGTNRTPARAFISIQLLTVGLAFTGPAQTVPVSPQILQPDAMRLLTLANEARAADGADPLTWDTALAVAALQHCLRMAAEAKMAHQFNGESTLTERAGQAGAHFSTIEENIASGSAPTDPIEFHTGWLDSPGHRANMLSHNVDRVGIAVVVSSGVAYAVADYTRAVPVLTREEVESNFSSLLRSRGLSILKDRRDARTYCAQIDGSRGVHFDNPPRYRMLWQNPDPAHLPQEILDRLAAERYRQAAVGSCPPQNVADPFTVYRVAVLLY